MNSVPAIVVIFHRGKHDYDSIDKILGRAITKCLVHTSQLPDASESLFSYIFKRGGPYDSQVKAAHRFVVENYQPGDHVMLLGLFWYESIGDSRYNAVVELATTLDTGTPAGGSGSTLVSGKIPIKCVYLDVWSGIHLRCSVIDRVLSHLPSTVENVLCISQDEAYVVQRGLHGQITRKEAWLSPDAVGRTEKDWFVLQTRHLVKYNPRLVGKIGQPRLLSTMTHSNCTKRRRGIPCSDGLPTGGQLTRVSKITWRDDYGTHEAVVWSSQSFLEGGYDDVCNAPLVGPRLV